MLSGCVTAWDWKPDPYMGDHEHKAVINADQNIIFAYEPMFSELTCFLSEDMKSLKENIERVKRNEAKTLKLVREKCSPEAAGELMDSLEFVPQ